MRLEGKVAVITGAGKGIGAAIARRFAAEGAKLVLIDRDQESVSGLSDELCASGVEAVSYPVDVTDRVAIDAAVKEALERFKTIDILVNNAGVVRDAMLHKMTEADWDTVMNINLKAAFHMIQAVIGVMRANSYGKIINMSSASRFGNVGQTSYAASKEALVGLTRALAKESGPKGINVNAVAPGTIVTDMYYAIPEHMRDIMKLITPLARAGEPEEVANLCLFLASDEASYITGQVIHCDGGIFMP